MREIVAEVPAGQIRGLTDGKLVSFRGVPYAAAPVGPLRFMLPAPRPAGFFDATVPGPTAQRVPLFDQPLVPEPTVPGEDTLQLSLFGPLDGFGDSSARRPVLVWVHGGGYAAGSPSSPWFDPRGLVADGSMLVTIGYRLSFDGFGMVPGRPMNRGLLDVLAALRWLRTNLPALGGDPDQVTLGGHSAGAGIALALAASPAAQGLFQRVLSISGVDFAHSIEAAARVSGDVASALGIPATEAGFASIDDVGYQSLTRSLRDANKPTPAYAPVIDGNLLPLSIPDGIANTSSDREFLAGATTEEFDGGVQRRTDFAGPRQTDVLFRSTCIRLARARPGSTWLYSFGWPSPKRGGAVHGIDLPFFFNALDATGVPEALGDDPPRELASHAHNVLRDFVRGQMPSWRSASGLPGDEALILDGGQLRLEDAYRDLTDGDFVRGDS